MADKIIVKKEKVTTLFNKIRTKAGVTGLKTFDEMNDVVDSIQTGGGSTDGKYRIRYFDIDGTVLKEEYLNEGDSLTPPDNPSYDSDYLVFDSWNYDIENTVVEDRDLDIGAIYNTIDNCTYMFCRFTTNTGLNPTLAISGSVTIDWGDGTIDSNLTHTYANEGNYIIKITGSFSFSTTSSVYLLGSENLNKALQKIYLDNITSIGERAFYNCSSLKSISIPNSVTSIGSDVFRSCSSLQSVSIPNSITSIVNYAFGYCYGLQNISIPKSITSIGTNAFQNCYSLQSINIPNSVKSIGGSAFYYCHSLTSINIPNSVTSIGDKAFNGCYSLKSISIPNSVKSIGDSVINSCYALPKINIPSSVTSIDTYAFGSCLSLTNYFILCDQVPTLSKTTAFSSISKGCIMWVNDAIIDKLKVATNWSTYASYMKPLSECPQDLLDENGIERPTPEPEPSGFKATFYQSSMYNTNGFYSVDGGNTWTQVGSEVTLENVTEVKLKITAPDYIPCYWQNETTSVEIINSFSEEVVSDTITLTEDTTFAYYSYD